MQLHLRNSEAALSWFIAIISLIDCIATTEGHCFVQIPLSARSPNMNSMTTVSRQIFLRNVYHVTGSILHHVAEQNCVFYFSIFTLGYAYNDVQKIVSKSTSAQLVCYCTLGWLLGWSKIAWTLFVTLCKALLAYWAENRGKVPVNRFVNVITNPVIATLSENPEHTVQYVTLYSLL